jgi:hypothetical protein
LDGHPHGYSRHKISYQGWAAMRYLDDLKSSQQKVHGQDYNLLSYRRYERAAAIADHGIVI